MNRLKAACLQMNATAHLEENLQLAESLLDQAASKKAKFAALPENFSWRGPSKDLGFYTKKTPQIIAFFEKLAHRMKIAVLLGSVPETASGGRCYNTSVLISEKGKVAASYRKIHLFGIALKKIKTDEASHVRPGKTPVLGKISGIPVGLSVCYDLRFPELYRHLTFRGARILTVPANFTAFTGKFHWEVLLRARAVENQAFVIAPGLTGISPSNKIQSYGNSLIIDPWGTILARGSFGRNECLVTDLDLGNQARLRKEFPVLKSQVLSKIR